MIAGDFDILHVQDPMLAYWCNRARKKGQVRTKEILAHGTEEGSAFLQRFEYVQHLAPWHLDQLVKYGHKKAQKAQKKKLPGILTTDYTDRTDGETGILVAKISFAWQIDCLQSPFHAFPDLAVVKSSKLS